MFIIVALLCVIVRNDSIKKPNLSIVYKDEIATSIDASVCSVMLVFASDMHKNWSNKSTTSQGI